MVEEKDGYSEAPSFSSTLFINEAGEKLSAAAVANINDCARNPAQAQTSQTAEQWELGLPRREVEVDSEQDKHRFSLETAEPRLTR